jgi:hypothetical protein
MWYSKMFAIGALFLGLACPAAANTVSALTPSGDYNITDDYSGQVEISLTAPYNTLITGTYNNGSGSVPWSLQEQASGYHTVVTQEPCTSGHAFTVVAPDFTMHGLCN